MLSEEIFDESRSSMTKVQHQRLVEKYNDNLKIIYDLCDFIAKSYIQNNSSVSLSLIKMCLKTLYSFLKWAPASFIFLTDFLDKIMIGLVGDLRHTVQCLQCLIECYSIPLDGAGFEEQELTVIRRKILESFAPLLQKLQEILPINLNFRQERINKQSNHNQLTLFDNITKETALLLSAFHKNHFKWVFHWTLEYYRLKQKSEYNDLCVLLESSLIFMVNLSDVENDPLYKICMEFWQIFTTIKVDMDKTFNKASQANSPGGLCLDNTKQDAAEVFKRIITTDIFSSLFKVIVRKMPRPQEILIETDDNGMPSKVSVDNTENAHLFSMAQSTLKNMTKINWENMSMILFDMINKQTDNSKFSYDLINNLSWAVGAINGELSVVEERQCLTSILRVASIHKRTSFR